MASRILRLHLASLTSPEGGEWPVHGFVILHERAGPILVDSGVGGPEKWLTDWRVVNVSAAQALADHDLLPSDIKIVINTHLHFDHCGQNAVFKHAPFFVQRGELDRARRESKPLLDWFDFAGARFELLDGDTEIAEGVRVIATPGHTVGHQSVLVATGREVGGPSPIDKGDQELMIGDAAYTSHIYEKPDREHLPGGQAADREAWRQSLRHIHELRPGHVHFCHDTKVVHS
jgi:glyoxylase-like metal-dependent hydrolase (beta-lactamase superfamily II)